MIARTRGISPKVRNDLLVSVVAFAIAYFGVELDPVLAATIAKLLGTVAGVQAAPGDIDLVFHDGPEPKDDGHDLHENGLT